MSETQVVEVNADGLVSIETSEETTVIETGDELNAGLNAKRAETARQGAEVAEGNAADSELAAATSEGNAAASETAAASSATDAQSSEDEAEQWAVSLTEVEPGLYGSRKYANDSSASASAAATSEGNALASEQAAAASETAAGLSEGAAAASEAAALLSEQNADQSEALSEQWATSQVLVDATNYGAKKYALDAGASETAAAGSASAASTSETNAGLSETAAAGSESAAALSETNAAASEGAASTSEANALASEQAAATSETNTANHLAVFQDQYWGAYASEPATSPTGAVADPGDLYFDTGVGAMKVYTTDSWVDATTTVEGVYDITEQTNVAGQTAFALAYDVGLLQVLYNGVQLAQADFTAIDGSNVTLVDAVASASDVITFMRWGAVTASSFLQAELDATLVDAKAYTDTHEGRMDDPHNVTKAQVGLGNVTNDAQLKLADKATTAEAESGTAGVFPDAAGVHAAFNQYGLGKLVLTSLLTLPNNLLADITVPGFYVADTTYADRPTRHNAWMTVAAGQLGRKYQEVQDSRFVHERFSRTFDGTDWSEWQLVYNQSNILGTVSENAGVPTGAIIERGSNANGEYTKFADGTMICRRASVVSTTIAGTGGGIYRSGEISLPLPATLTASVMTTPTTKAHSNNVWIIGSVYSSTNFSLRLLAGNVLSADDYSVFLIVIGRWF